MGCNVKLLFWRQIRCHCSQPNFELHVMSHVYAYFRGGFWKRRNITPWFYKDMPSHCRPYLGANVPLFYLKRASASVSAVSLTVLSHVLTWMDCNCWNTESQRGSHSLNSDWWTHCWPWQTVTSAEPDDWRPPWQQLSWWQYSLLIPIGRKLPHAKQTPPGSCVHYLLLIFRRCSLLGQVSVDNLLITVLEKKI